MKREIAISAAACAALLFAAGSGMAQNTLTEAEVFQNLPIMTLQDADNAIDLTVEQCENAWAASEAYDECGDRSPVEGAGQAESIEPVGNLCVIATSCEYYVSNPTDIEGVATLTLGRRDTNWNGGLANAAMLKNCNGSLWPSC